MLTGCFFVPHVFPRNVQRILLTGKVLISAKVVPEKKKRQAKQMQKQSKVGCFCMFMCFCFAFFCSPFFTKKQYLMVGYVRLPSLNTSLEEKELRILRVFKKKVLSLERNGALSD